MHAGFRFFIVAGAALAAPLQVLAAGAPPVVAFSPAVQAAGHWPQFTRGTPKDVVAAKLGMPSQVVSAELWIYREFRTDYFEANQRGYDTLLVVFEAGRVHTMRVVNGGALDALLAAHRRAAASRIAAGGAVAAPSMGYSK